MVVIFFFSAQPSLPGPPDPLLNIIIRKLGHLSEYAILMLLLLRATSARPLTRSSVALCLLAVILYAASDEYHQSFVATRQTTVTDVLIDTLGGTIGLLIWQATKRRSVTETLDVTEKALYK